MNYNYIYIKFINIILYYYIILYYVTLYYITSYIYFTTYLQQATMARSSQRGLDCGN